MKKLFLLSIIIVMLFWTSAAYAAAPYGNWCTDWPIEEQVPRVWVNNVGVRDTCDNPFINIETWAFVWGWSKIQVENTKVFWEIYKPFPENYYVADIGWLGVSSNAGGRIMFTWGPLQLITIDSGTDLANIPLWNTAVDLVTPEYTEAEKLDPNWDPEIEVDYYLMDKIWVDKTNDPSYQPGPDGTPNSGDEGYWEETGVMPENLIPMASGSWYPEEPATLAYCCHAWDIYQMLTISTKQPKGVYYGSLKAEFKVTCYDAQNSTTPYRPTGFDASWTEVNLRNPNGEPE